MKDEEILFVMSENWMSINKIKKKLNANWEKLFSQLRKLELMGLVESFEKKQRKNVYRHYRKIKTDPEKLKDILNTSPEDRSTKDHKYICLHKYKNNLRNYITSLIKEVKNEPN